jgi:hypothetical protein
MANKRQKDRVTANQFDQALLEEIQQKRGMNIPVNALSSAVTFAIMIHNRLFGVRTAAQRSGPFNEAFERLMTDAKAERAAYAIQQEQEQKKLADQSRIVLPTGFRNN